MDNLNFEKIKKINFEIDNSKIDLNTIKNYLGDNIECFESDNHIIVIPINNSKPIKIVFENINTEKE